MNGLVALGAGIAALTGIGGGIGIGIASYINLLDPEKIVLAGGMSNESLLIEQIQKVVKIRRMRFAGNVPPIEVMKDGSIDDVIEACKDCLRKCGDNPKGYILNTGCQLPIGTPKRNVEAFIYAARKYGRGAQLGKLPRGILED